MSCFYGQRVKKSGGANAACEKQTLSRSSDASTRSRAIIMLQ